MPLRDDLLNEIPGANPSGSNIRYDPAVDLIKEARREEADVAQGDWKTAVKTADYPQVIKLASELIAKRSKDLQVAVWLVDAHVRRDGFAMLAPGFEFLRKLLEQYWETLYPEIEDGDVELRAAPLEWLGTKLDHPLMLLPITSNGLNFAQYKNSRTVGYEQDAATPEKREARQQAIKDGVPTAEEFDEAISATSREFYEKLQNSFTVALDELRELSNLSDEKFGADYSPNFSKTRTAIENLAQQIRIFLSKKPAPVAAPPPPPPPEPQATAIPSPAPTPVAAAPVPSPAPVAAPAPQFSAGPAPADFQDSIARAGAICQFLRDNTTFDASALLLIRAFRWSELRAHAPDVKPQMLQPPPPEVRVGLKERFAASDWDGVLVLTESAMLLPCGRCWLDLQRFTVQALEQKGDYFAKQAGFVQNALRTLLEELPALLDQVMIDETPVANAETRAWIDDAVLAGITLPAAVPVQQQQAPAPPPPPPVAVVEEIEISPPDLEPEEESQTAPVAPDVFEEAMAAAQASRAEEALEIISRQLSSERSGRGRFRRRTQLAHLLMMGGHKQIALPILEQLAAEIDQRNLADWERNEALAYPVDLLLRCLDANGSDDADRKQLYARLCRLDPVRALKSTTS